MLTGRLTDKYPKMGFYVFFRTHQNGRRVWRIGCAHAEKGIGRRLEDHRDALNTYLLDNEVAQYHAAFAFVDELRSVPREGNERKNVADAIEQELVHLYKAAENKVPPGNRHDKQQYWGATGRFCTDHLAELESLMNRFLALETQQAGVGVSGG